MKHALGKSCGVCYTPHGAAETREPTITVLQSLCFFELLVFLLGKMCLHLTGSSDKILDEKDCLIM